MNGDDHSPTGPDARAGRAVAPAGGDGARVADEVAAALRASGGASDLDDFPALAAELCGAPMAAVSLLGMHTQHLVARTGIVAAEASRDIASCIHTLRTDGAFAVADAVHDPRFSDNPLVGDEPRVGAYAGMAIGDREGGRIGSLFVAWHEPHQLSAAGLASLERLARQLARRIQLQIALVEADRAKQAVRESEQRFRHALEALDHVAVQAYDLDGRVSFWNRASEMLYGRAAEEALGADIVTLLFPLESHAAERELLARIEASGDGAAAGEVVLQRADGSTATVYASRVLVPSADGTPEFFCFDVDITARRAAEDALRASEERMRRISDSIPGAILRFILRVDDTSSIEYMSRGCEEIWELDAASIIGDTAPLRAMVLPEDLAALMESVRESARTLEQWRHQWRIRTPSGVLKWLAGSGIPTRCANGDVVWSSFILDRSPQAMAEAALARSEARYRAIAENIPGAIFRYLLHPDGRHSVEFISRGARVIWEVEPEAIMADAAKLSEAIHPDDLQGVRASMGDSARTLGLWQHRWRISTPTGRRKWLQGSGRPIRRDDGDIAWDGYVQDVTERREAEAALALSEARLRVLLESAPEAIVVFDVQAGCFVDYNGKASRLFGLDDPARQSGWPAAHSPELQPDRRSSQEAAVGYISRAVAGEEPVFEWVHLDREGHPVPCEVHLVRVPDATRTLVRGSLIDIRPRKAAEEALRASEARFGLIVQNMLDGFFILDASWRIIDVNAAAATTTGRPVAGLVGQDLRALFPGEEDRPFGRAYASVLGGGPATTVSGYHPILQGWYEARVQPAANGIAVFFSDISERRRAEQALRDSEYRFRSLVEDIGTIAVHSYDRERRITFWNRASERLYGWTAEEALGRRLEDLIILPAMRAAMVDLIEQWLAAGRVGVPSEETVLLHRDGTPVPVYSSHVMQLKADGEPELYRLDIDLRSLRRTEAALQEANAALEQRNRDLQQFLMAASHDLQEPLRKVQAFGDLLQSSLDDRLRPPERDHLARMQAAAGRMRDLLHDLLGYATVASASGQRADVDLEALVRGVLDDLEPELSAAAACVSVTGLPRMAGDSAQLRQLFINLIGNALKYRSRTRAPRIDIDAVPGPAMARPATRIRVADNGIGFDDAHRERIFQPFQRLHSHSEYPGTGLGLAIVRRIAEQHGGQVQAHGWPGEGAEFVVDLSLEGCPAPAKPAS
jgi:PAS domain S-box-containing protein